MRKKKTGFWDGDENVRKGVEVEGKEDGWMYVGGMGWNEMGLWTDGYQYEYVVCTYIIKNR